MSVERQIIFWALVLGALGYALHLLGTTVAPFAAGIALGYLLDPLVGQIERLGLNRLGAALIILVVFAATFSVALIVVVPVLGNQLITFAGKLPGYVMKLQSARAQRGLDAGQQVPGRLDQHARPRRTALVGSDPEVDRRFRHSGRAVADRRPAGAGVGRRRRVQLLLAPDHHAGRRLLHPDRLGPDDRRTRRLAAARPSRRLAQDRAGDRSRAGGLHPRPVAGLPVSRPLVRDRPDAGRARLRLPDRRDRRRSELRALCRLADGARPVDRGLAGSGLAEPEAVFPGARGGGRRPVSRGQRRSRRNWSADRSAFIRSG